MNTSPTNLNLSNNNGDENGKTIVTPSNQIRSTESDRSAGKRRESFVGILMRCLSGISF